MPSTVERFFQVLSEIVPNYKEYLNPPCDPSLFAEIENLIGEELPAAFKEFYSIADGEIQYYFNIDGETHYRETLNLAFGQRFADLSEMLTYYKSNVGGLLDIDDNYYIDDYSFSYNGNRVKSHIIFHRKWFPIICADGGNFHSLDYAPADEGIKGQIINHSVSGDDQIWYDYASSFENFIQLLTNLMIENKAKYADNQSLFGDVDIDAIGKNSCILPIDDIQKEKFHNLPFEWKEYFKTITPTIKNNKYCYDEEATLKQLSKICELRLRSITEDHLNNGYKGIFPENQGFVMEDTYRKMLQDITPLILMPRIKQLSFWYEINLSQLDFVSKYLTQIYKMFIPNVFQQEELKIIGKFKCLFELQLNCGKIDDFSDLLSCKDLAKLILCSSENLNLTALSELKELRLLNIVGSPNIESFSAFSAFKNKLTVEMTREQFLKAHTYMDKNKIKPLLIVPYGVVEQPATDEEQIIINAWFGYS